MKIAVMGGGSTYTPELIVGFLERVEQLPVSELWLMDPDAERLRIVGGFSQRIVEAKGCPFQVRLTRDGAQAVEGASYVLVQLRVGGMEARRQDEYLGHRHGLIGQETTGVGGMANALRTIPIVLHIANLVNRLAPGALLINFSNPSGLVTEALSRYAKTVNAVGLCNAPLGMLNSALETYRQVTCEPVDPSLARLDTLGLNHLTWHRGITLEGRDIWPLVLPAYLAELSTESGPSWEKELIQALGAVPNYYLHYYYHTSKKLAEQKAWPPSRAEEVMVIEAELLEEYADTACVEPPKGLLQRGGAYYSTAAAQLIEAHHNDLGQVHVVNVPHAGAVPGWPDDWVLEMPCRVFHSGIQPLPAEPLAPVCAGLLAQVKAYELLTVEAAVHGDRQAAYQALLAHPLGPEADQVAAVLDDMLEVNRPHLPAFWNP